MRYLVVSDIHANLEALDAVMAAAGSYDHILALGDFVGYGADPNAVIERVRAWPSVTCIRGNHDKVAAGLADTEGFNHLAKRAIGWTAGALTPDSQTWLAALPQGPVVVDALVEICHGTPFDEDIYVFDDLDAMRALRASERPLCLYGHTHVPATFVFDSHVRVVTTLRGDRVEVPAGTQAQYLVNCGAVGQPRDGDPRAAFGILDTADRSVTFKRVPYDIATAQAKIIRAGLPDVLAQRLAVGR